MASSINLNDKSGYLHLIVGPMFCGKTNELLNELHRFDMVGSSVMYLNHSLDDRADTPFSTHHPLVKSMGNIKGYKTDSLLSQVEHLGPYDVIGIDEAQFFPDLLPFVKLMVDTHGKRVIIAGLNGSFRREPIGEILHLIPWADRVDHLTAMCLLCAEQRGEMKPAPFSHRRHQEKEEKEEKGKEDILVGANDKYMAVCRGCFTRLQVHG